MRILQLANLYGPKTGGLRTVLDESGREYARQGHEVLRIVPGPRTRESTDGAVESVEVRAPTIPGTGGYRAIIDRDAVRDALARFAPQVVELADKTTLLAPAQTARRGGSVVALVSHERIDAILEARVPSHATRRVAADVWNRRLLRSVDAVVCASQFAAEEFVRVGGRPRVVPLGVDHATFRPAPGRADDARVAARVSLLYVGRLSVEKDPMLAVRTLQELDARGVPASLLMVGDGPERRRLAKAAGGADVVFEPHTRDRAHLATLFRAADVLLATCACETFGLAALEALACGTPVVVPTGGALREMLGPEAGVVTAPTPDRFADGVERLVAGDRSDVRTRAAARSASFSWARTATTMLALYDELLARSGPRVVPG